MTAALLLLAWADPVACIEIPIQPGGTVIETRVLSAPPRRVREVVSDAVRAAGMHLIRDSEAAIEAEGKEIVRVTLEGEPAGKTNVRAETIRSGGKKGTPKRLWSSPILAHAACLLEVFAREAPSATTRISLEPGTPVLLRLRRFYSSSDPRPDRVLALEVAMDVQVGGIVMVPRGTPAQGRVQITRDDGSFGRGARGRMLPEAIVMGPGQRLPLEGSESLKGQDDKGKAVALGIAIAPWAGAATTGKEIRLPAGTLVSAKVSGGKEVK